MRIKISIELVKDENGQHFEIVDDNNNLLASGQTLLELLEDVDINTFILYKGGN